MLVYTDGEYLDHWDDEDRGALFVQTQDLTDEPLVEAAPQQIWTPQPCFGVRHRPFDLFDAERFEDYSRLELMEGTKIGGRPRWIQSDDPPPRPKRLSTKYSV